MASAVDKLHCAERELALRLRVYRERITRGTMREEEARREIALMEEIAADYRALAEGEPPGPLFAPPEEMSPAVSAAMGVFERGLAARRAAEHHTCQSSLRSGSAQRCGARASFVIDGVPLCRRHAGLLAVDLIRVTP